MSDHDESSHKTEADARAGFARSTRRTFLSRMGLASLLATTGPVVTTWAQSSGKMEPALSNESKDAIPVTLRVNGKKYDLRIDPRTSLLDCLREHLHLTGSKKGCDHGQCGACTVHVNGRRQLSCLSFAALHEDDEITTIEGIGQPDKMHPMQEAVCEMRCLSMRLLHVGTDHVGGRALEGAVRARGRGGERIHERQHLPLRRVSEHRGRHSRSAARREGGMKTFQLTKPKDGAQASAATSKAKTAQQGADIRFIAGGTTVDRLDEVKCRAATEFGRCGPAATRQNRSDSRWRPNDWGDGAQFRTGLAPARAQELPGPF